MTDSVSISDQLFHFADDLETALSAPSSRTFECDTIVLCGVGGSAVSGDIVADCCAPRSSKPVISIHYPGMPSWVGPNTLVVVSSYSGNTAETLEMYNQATSRGCSVVALTSGGDLLRAASRDGATVIRLPEGMHPRHAIGHMIGHTLAVVRDAGGSDLTDEILSVIPSLREYRNAVSGGSGRAKVLARELYGHVPVIVCDSRMRSVAFRWKTQINENSKFVAFCESAPPFDGWEHGDREGRCLPVILCGRTPGDEQASEGMDGIDASLNAIGHPHMMVEFEGSTWIETMFKAIILGDYMSVYMAEIRGIDPSEVKPVMQLKAKLASLRER